MDRRLADDAPELLRFGIGQPVLRREDPILVSGRGSYTDDQNVAGQRYAWMVRSTHAHGVLNGVDLATARAMPGVLGAWSAADLAPAGYGTPRTVIGYPNRDGSALKEPPYQILAEGKVRFVGQPVAFVVADSPAAARDAAEAVVVDVTPLPAVTDARAAVAPDAPRLHDDAPGNVCLDFANGDLEAVDAAFASAAHVTRLTLSNNRIVVSAMEPRAAIGEYDPASERWTLHTGCQGVMGLRGSLAKSVLGVPLEKVRILTGNVGGSFGMKSAVYPEYVCILHAARELGAPVKWTDDRSQSFLSDHHGRDQVMDCALALDADGRFLALRIDGVGAVGAWASNFGPHMPTMGVVKNIIGVYRTPLVAMTSKAVFTNTTPLGPYRGAGRPEGNYYMERLVDAAARELGIDGAELRRRNMITPAQMPYKTPTGLTYDSGDFAGLMDEALARADWAGFDARRAESEARGKLRGRGFACYLEITAPAVDEMGGVRFEADGSVTILTGTLDYGQGHWSTFAQVLHQRLGVPFDRIRLLQGDSDQLVAGGGTGGSKSVMASGMAVHEASDLVIDKGRQAAAWKLEAAADDIGFARGRFSVSGTDLGVDIMDLEAALREARDLPEGTPRTLSVTHVHKSSPATFPNGCHVAEVEVDPDTGGVELVRYSMVNDFGTLVNPMLVEGQAHGGVVQGISQALLERVVYDDSGQPLTGSYMDYAIARAGDTPTFGFADRPQPATTNPLGVKGCGEAGCAGSLPSVMNAVADALASVGVEPADMPATPERVWRLLQAAR